MSHVNRKVSLARQTNAVEITKKQIVRKAFNKGRHSKHAAITTQNWRHVKFLAFLGGCFGISSSHCALKTKIGTFLEIFNFNGYFIFTRVTRMPKNCLGWF